MTRTADQHHFVFAAPRPATSSAAVLLAAWFAACANADDWPHWRGPNRSGIVAEPSGYDGKTWLPAAPAWKKSFGAGSTSPLAADRRLYTLGWSGGRDTVYCVDAADGAELWKQSYECPQYGRHSEGDKDFYRGPSATPELDEQTGLLYTLSIDGHLNCWDISAEGRRVWGINLYDQYGAPRREGVGRGRNQRDYGYTAAPLVSGESLIVEVGAAEGALMGFDKRTGERLWKSQCADMAGHTGGLVPITLDGVSCVAVLTLTNLLVARLDRGREGETAALYPWATDYANNIPTPAVHDNFVFVTSAYDHSAICKLRITLAGAEKIWQQPYASGVCSPVIHEGCIYWAWRGVHCLDLQTGREKWSGGGVGYPGSCIVTADDRLIVWTNNGDLLLVETARRSPAAYTEAASRKGLFGADAWPHVVLAGGRLYCKDRNGNLACFALAMPQ